jgi:hypothetical protein
MLAFAVPYVIALVAAIAPTRLRETTWLLVILLTQGGSFLLGFFSVRGSVGSFFILFSLLLLPATVMLWAAMIVSFRQRESPQGTGINAR